MYREIQGPFYHILLSKHSNFNILKQIRPDFLYHLLKEESDLLGLDQFDIKHFQLLLAANRKEKQSEPAAIGELLGMNYQSHKLHVYIFTSPFTLSLCFSPSWRRAQSAVAGYLYLLAERKRGIEFVNEMGLFVTDEKTFCQ